MAPGQTARPSVRDRLDRDWLDRLRTGADRASAARRTAGAIWTSVGCHDVGAGDGRPAGRVDQRPPLDREPACRARESSAASECDGLPRRPDPSRPRSRDLGLVRWSDPGGAASGHEVGLASGRQRLHRWRGGWWPPETIESLHSSRPAMVGCGRVADPRRRSHGRKFGVLNGQPSNVGGLERSPPAFGAPVIVGPRRPRCLRP